MFYHPKKMNNKSTSQPTKDRENSECTLSHCASFSRLTPTAMSLTHPDTKANVNILLGTLGAWTRRAGVGD